ncbi:MAG TPA: substrate-binding domain-containing protein [Xanthobacteraceae bacterium]|jgi:molybdate transport system substrate-binding protein|nr:substrate-binding domain-containing protein [Xanthobacteraceae bacterium]
MANQPAAIRILCTLGLRGVLTDIAPMLAASGIGFDASYGATNMLLGRMAEGESADVAILVDAAIDALTRQGTIAAGSPRDLARSGVGIAVKAGAAKPDIGTIEAFRGAMLAARSIGYSKSGASGLHFAELIGRLGIAAEVTRKAKVQDGVVGELAATGEVEIAVQQISELKLVDGIDIVGSLPDELQKLTVFSAGVFAASAQPARAAALIAALARPEVAAVMRHKGLEPLAPVV